MTVEMLAIMLPYIFFFSMSNTCDDYYSFYILCQLFSNDFLVNL